MNKLPIEVIYKIMAYTYQPQPSFLLEDIRDFHKSRETMDKMYFKKWCHHTREVHSDWLINDIFIYMNKSQPTMFGYCNHFRNIIYRNPFIKDAELYIRCTELEPVQTQINRFVSLFNGDERNEFINQDFLLEY